MSVHVLRAGILIGWVSMVKIGLGQPSVSSLEVAIYAAASLVLTAGLFLSATAFQRVLAGLSTATIVLLAGAALFGR